MDSINNKVEKVGCYVRISDQDRAKLTKVQLSRSIENQISMLKEECKKRKWVITDLYCDEDISGADETRPEFNRLLKDCEQGRINVVLCKSQDRFARDMEMIEKYIHNKFVEWGVRFVTIVDRADSNIKENKKNRQITGLTNQWYLEDLSNNIKTTFDIKRTRGEFIGSFAPYGYSKERDMRNALHLVVDPISSEIVKRIFEEYSIGKSINSIIKGLNEDQILSPSEYKWSNGIFINTPKKTYSSNSFITAGSYEIKSSYFNDKITNNNKLYLICKFKKSDEKFSKKCSFRLKDTNAKKVYYFNEEIDINNIFKKANTLKNQKKINVGDVIPSDVTYLFTYFTIQKKYEEYFINIELYVSDNAQQNTIEFEPKSFYEGQISNIFKTSIRCISAWSRSTINKILQNPVYTGALIQGKTTTVSYKNHTTIKLPQSKWKIIPNAHEPIISKELWQKACERKGKNIKPKNQDYVNIFSGVLKCAYCGRNMVSTKCGKANGKYQKSYYVCSDRKSQFKNCLNRKQLRKDELEKLVLIEINKLIKQYKDEKKIKRFYKQIKSNDQEHKTKLDSLKLEKEKLLKEKEKIDKYIKNLYESKTNRLIDSEEYFSFKSSYKENKEKITKRLNKIQEEYMYIQKNETVIAKKSILQEYDYIENLTYEIVHELISEIKVGIKNDNDERNIEFLWNF